VEHVHYHEHHGIDFIGVGRAVDPLSRAKGLCVAPIGKCVIRIWDSRFAA
jgi:hypothetical protein